MAESAMQDYYDWVWRLRVRRKRQQRGNALVVHARESNMEACRVAGVLFDGFFNRIEREVLIVCKKLPCRIGQSIGHKFPPKAFAAKINGPPSWCRAIIQETIVIDMTRLNIYNSLRVGLQRDE